jgi:hypothetical protein
MPELAVDHVLRSGPPWREENLTECGKPTAGKTIITRVEFIARWKDYGKTRTAMLTCITCIETAGRWPTWDEDPARAAGREYVGKYGHLNSRDQWRNELRALTALAEAHPDEFVQLMADLGNTASLADARRARRAKRGA